MTDSYRYFTIPFDAVPATPSYTVWFSRFAPDRPGVVWDTARPPIGTAWVIGATDDGVVPDAAHVVGFSTKCIAPPPMAISPKTSSVDDLQRELAVFLKRVGNARAE